jgi:hypothetical protein
VILAIHLNLRFSIIQVIGYIVNTRRVQLPLLNYVDRLLGFILTISWINRVIVQDAH